MIPATKLAMIENSVQYQNSERAARPVNVAYLLNPDLIASMKFIILVPPVDRSIGKTSSR